MRQIVGVGSLLTAGLLLALLGLLWKLQRPASHLTRPWG